MTESTSSIPSASQTLQANEKPSTKSGNLTQAANTARRQTPNTDSPKKTSSMYAEATKKPLSAKNVPLLTPQNIAKYREYIDGKRDEPPQNLSENEFRGLSIEVAKHYHDGNVPKEMHIKLESFLNPDSG